MLTKSSKPQSSIIIPVYNNLIYTKACLKSIFANTDLSNIEIIVVDNASTDGTREYLNNVHPQCPVTLIPNTTNLGFARACNQGARASTGKYLVFLNNDTRVTPGWLDSMVLCSDSDKRIGVVGAKLLFEDGLIQHAGVVFDYKLKPVHIYKFFHPKHPAVEKQRDFQAVSGACMLVKKSVYKKLGGFDELYVNGYEDVDFCLRLQRQGYRVVYCPKSVVIHLESKTPGRFDAMDANRALLMERWGEVLLNDDHEYYQADGIRHEILQEHEHGHVCLMHDSNENVYWHRARMLAEQGEDLKAVEAFHQAFRFYAFDLRKVIVLKELASIYEKLEMPSHTEKCLRGVLELDPQPDHYLLLGKFLKKQGRLDEAARLMAARGHDA